MVRGLIALAMLAFALRAGAESRPPVRVASINLCTDQLLLDLAKPGQIAGLSPLARDPARSWAAARVGASPVFSGTAEEIMMLRPTHVLASRYMKGETREFIRRAGVTVEEFDVVTTVAEARDQIGRVARLLGAEAEGVARIAALDAALARLKAAASGSGLRVLPYARRGWAAGRDSLQGDLLAAAGLVNPVDESGLRYGAFLSLEAVVRLRPDAILLGRDGGAAEDQGQAMLLHPAMQALFPPERRIFLPEALVNCGGPMLVEAMDRLAAEIARIRPREKGGR